MMRQISRTPVSGGRAAEEAAIIPLARHTHDACAQTDRTNFVDASNYSSRDGWQVRRRWHAPRFDVSEAPFEATEPCALDEDRKVLYASESLPSCSAMERFYVAVKDGLWVEARAQASSFSVEDIDTCLDFSEHTGADERQNIVGAIRCRLVRCVAGNVQCLKTARSKAGRFLLACHADKVPQLYATQSPARFGRGTDEAKTCLRLLMHVYTLLQSGSEALLHADEIKITAYKPRFLGQWVAPKKIEGQGHCVGSAPFKNVSTPLAATAIGGSLAYLKKVSIGSAAGLMMIGFIPFAKAAEGLAGDRFFRPYRLTAKECAFAEHCATIEERMLHMDVSSSVAQWEALLANLREAAMFSPALDHDYMTLQKEVMRRANLALRPWLKELQQQYTGGFYSREKTLELLRAKFRYPMAESVRSSFDAFVSHLTMPYKSVGDTPWKE